MRICLLKYGIRKEDVGPPTWVNLRIDNWTYHKEFSQLRMCDVFITLRNKMDDHLNFKV
jgi:hypothetical protein